MGVGDREGWLEEEGTRVIPAEGEEEEEGGKGVGVGSAVEDTVALGPDAKDVRDRVETEVIDSAGDDEEEGEMEEDGEREGEGEVDLEVRGVAEDAFTPVGVGRDVPIAVKLTLNGLTVRPLEGVSVREARDVVEGRAVV